MSRRTGPTSAMVATVRDRDSWRCARCGAGQGALTTQHRVARGMGGTRAAWINGPANLITLCGSGTTGCHGWVERSPDAGQRLGLSVARWADPATVPVWTWRGWLLLELDGTATVLPDFPADRDAHDSAQRHAA